MAISVIPKASYENHHRFFEMDDANFRRYCERLRRNDPDIMEVQFDEDYLATNEDLTKLQHICESLVDNTVVYRFTVVLLAMPQHVTLALTQLLKRNTTLKTLEFMHCGFSDVGIKHICDGLEQNCTITYLEVKTKLKSKSWLAICDMLKKNTSIKKLRIFPPFKISKEAKASLVRTVIEDNSTLQEIHMVCYNDHNLRIIFQTIAYLNTDGRRRKIMKQTNDVPVGLWAHIFAFTGGRCIDVLYYFVKSKPELFKF